MRSTLERKLFRGKELTLKYDGKPDSLTEKVMPAFIDWLKTTLAIPDDSNAIRMVPYFGAYWKDGKLEVEMGFRNQRNQ